MQYLLKGNCKPKPYKKLKDCLRVGNVERKPTSQVPSSLIDIVAISSQQEDQT